ncbi:Hypothetical protein A7982_10957 [Minicystis rosea]|nr:Hypothetical protein A7982_10957 [Minicystis rosea]
MPQTFGHYTSDIIDHGDEIVLQVSKLLFEPKKRNPDVVFAEPPLATD